MTTSNEHNNAPSVQQGRPFGHFRAEPFGWTDCAATDDGAIALYEHPMTNPWRDAVIEQLESWHIYVPAIHDNSPRLAIKALVNMECKAALDPAVSSEAAALAAQGVQAHTPAVPQGLPAFDDLDDDVIDAACTAGSLLYRVDLMRAYECIRKALAATPTPAPAQEPVTLTPAEIDRAVLEATGFDGFGCQPMNTHDTRNIGLEVIAALRAKGGK